jgi:transposase InsO family protein
VHTPRKGGDTPMRLTPDLRRLIGEAIDRWVNKSSVAEVLGVTRKIVDKWNKRRKHLKDRKRKKKKLKITLPVELSIIALRNTFDWGTARIQQGLINLPPYMREVLPDCVQGVRLSRTAINDILKKHKLNGYKKKSEGWKFFRAKKPNELWQLDIKGPFRVKGKKYYFVICIDDYSRYVVLAEQLDHSPCVKEICSLLKPLVKKHKPNKILTDNNPFKEEWDKWCKEEGIEPLHAHPYYPQDKGKVERAIRNFAEEFVYLLKKFPEWLDGKIKEYQKWFNRKRFHRGINAIPYELYT